MTSKKSQMQISETVAVLAVFFILALGGATLYFNLAKSNIKAEVDASAQLGSIGIVQRVLSLPEIACTENNVVTANCVDMLKVEALSLQHSKVGPSNLETAGQIIKGKETFYFDVFGFSSITVERKYPEPDNGQIFRWIVYDNKRDDFSTQFTTKLPITIHDPTNKKNYFGVLTVETYS